MGTPPVDPRIVDLRGKLAEIDRRIVELVADRQALAMDLGRLKAAHGRATRDFAQEKEVIDRARRTAAGLHLAGDVAEELMLLLIRTSLTAQEQDRVQSSGGGGGQRILVIGGAGRMGAWLARFLASQAYDVEIADPVGPLAGFSWIGDWRRSSLDHDLIVVAAPLRASNETMIELAERRPRGIVFDIGSLKTPLRSGLMSLVRAGVAVTSIHPMFGPDTELLSGRHVIFVDVGVSEATRRVRDLFASTMAIQVEMDLDSHDRLVAYVLGLSHAANIAFTSALADSGEAAERLSQLSSTTFDAQLAVARRVVGENPHLYYEIQALNDYGHEALDALSAAAQRVREVVARGDEAAFVGLMERGDEYLRAVQARDRAPEP